MGAIKDLWRALGRQMRSASDIEALQFRYRRAGVNRAFTAMRDGEIPGAPLECRYGVPPALLTAFDARRKAALDVAVQRASKPMPIGDQASGADVECVHPLDA